MENIRVMISEEDVNKRIAEMGAQISEDYAGKEIHLIAILKGSEKQNEKNSSSYRRK